MKRFIILSAIIFTIGTGATVTHSATPAQVATAESTAKNTALTKFRMQLEKKRKTDVTANTQAETALKAKASALTKVNVGAEVTRRTEAAEKAARINAQIVATVPASAAPVSRKRKSHLDASRPTNSKIAHQQRQLHRARAPTAAPHAK